MPMQLMQQAVRKQKANEARPASRASLLGPTASFKYRLYAVSAVLNQLCHSSMDQNTVWQLCSDRYNQVLYLEPEALQPRLKMHHPSAMIAMCCQTEYNDTLSIQKAQKWGLSHCGKSAGTGVTVILVWQISKHKDILRKQQRS